MTTAIDIRNMVACALGCAEVDQLVNARQHIMNCIIEIEHTVPRSTAWMNVSRYMRQTLIYSVDCVDIVRHLRELKVVTDVLV